MSRFYTHLTSPIESGRDVAITHAPICRILHLPTRPKVPCGEGGAGQMSQGLPHTKEGPNSAKPPNPHTAQNLHESTKCHSANHRRALMETRQTYDNQPKRASAGISSGSPGRPCYHTHCPPPTNENTPGMAPRLFDDLKGNAAHINKASEPPANVQH